MLLDPLGDTVPWCVSRRAEATQDIEARGTAAHSIEHRTPASTTENHPAPMLTVLRRRTSKDLEMAAPGLSPPSAAGSGKSLWKDTEGTTNQTFSF